jgi:hypothetical protein
MTARPFPVVVTYATNPIARQSLAHWSDPLEDPAMGRHLSMDDEARHIELTMTNLIRHAVNEARRRLHLPSRDYSATPAGDPHKEPTSCDD